MMYAPIRLMNLCIPHFKENGWDSIVTMASMFGKQPGGLLSYDAIKAADIMISKDYSNYCAPFNVNVNSVCPRPVATPLWYEKGQLGDQLAAVTGKSVEESINGSPKPTFLCKDLLSPKKLPMQQFTWLLYRDTISPEQSSMSTAVWSRQSFNNKVKGSPAVFFTCH